MNNKFYSQFGQDKLVYNLFFQNKKDGFFIDIGAANGIDISNTYFFEKNLGWKGICVEPRIPAYKDLIKNRSCICENICISDNDGEQPFFEYSGEDGVYSGLKSKYDTRHEQRVQSCISQKKKEIVVRTVTMRHLCEKYNIKHIDFCSIDTEGGELDIIKSLGDSSVSIDCITVENNFHDKDIRRYMKSKKFAFLKTIECDEIYISNKLRKRVFRYFLQERLKYEYYRNFPRTIRISLNKLGISKIVKMLVQ